MSKLTKKQLQGMSDIQILRKLYELLGFEVHEYVFEEVITIRSGDKVTTAELSPNDIMPLAFEYKIGLQPARSEWQAFAATSDFYDDTNPLRAIACCLILVLQEGS